MKKLQDLLDQRLRNFYKNHEVFLFAAEFIQC